MAPPNIKDDDETPASAFGPYANPLERYADLPKHTRMLLEALDKEDCQTLIEVLKSYQRAAAIGWFFKWLIAFMVGTFLAVVGLGDAIRRVAEWWRGV